MATRRKKERREFWKTRTVKGGGICRGMKREEGALITWSKTRPFLCSLPPMEKGWSLHQAVMVAILIFFFFFGPHPCYEHPSLVLGFPSRTKGDSSPHPNSLISFYLLWNTCFPHPKFVASFKDQLHWWVSPWRNACKTRPSLQASVSTVLTNREGQKPLWGGVTLPAHVAVTVGFLTQLNQQWNHEFYLWGILGGYGTTKLETLCFRDFFFGGGETG